MNYINRQSDVTDKKETIANKVAQKKILWRDLLIVLALAVSLRTVCSLRSFGDAENRQMEEDSYGYRTLANNLINGQGFGRMRPVGPQGKELWTPELCRTPGYPLLIAGFEWLTGHGRAATIVFQQILGIILCLMAMVIGQRYFGRKAGLVAGCLLALDLQAIGLSNILLAESVYCFLLFFSVILVVKCMESGNTWFSLGAGLLLGVSILVKPVGVGLPLVLSVVMIIYAYIKQRKHMIPAAFIICVLAYLPVCGWVIRNGIVCGEYVLSSVGRSSLLQWSSAMTLARSHGISREVASERLGALAGVSNTSRIRYGGLSPEQARKVREVAISTIIENRSAFIKEFTISCINLFFGPEKNTLLALGLPYIAFGIQENDATSLSDFSAASVTILAFETLVLGSIYVMLFITLWKCIKLRRLPSFILVCLISALYILALSSIPPGCPRYRSAPIPLLVVSAAASFGLNRQAGYSRKIEVDSFAEADK